MRVHEPGIYLLDGWWFTAGMPPGLQDLPRPPMHASSAERQASQEQYDWRIPYKFRVNARIKGGGYRLRGPAVPDSARRDTRGLTPNVRGIRVRCVNSPYYRQLPRTLSATTCREGVPCACSKTFTVRAEDIPNFCEEKLWGTSSWAREYARRNLSEASFSHLTYHLGVNAHSIRVRAQKWPLAFAFIQAAAFIRLFYNWIRRLGGWDHDPAFWDPLDPEIFRPALERVLTPSASTAQSGRRARPPSRE